MGAAVFQQDFLSGGGNGNPVAFARVTKYYGSLYLSSNRSHMQDVLAKQQQQKNQGKSKNKFAIFPFAGCFVLFCFWGSIFK